jgi:hypothetical protein
VISYLGKLQLESLLKVCHRLNLLSQLGALSLDFSFDDSAFILHKSQVLDLSFEQLNFHLLGLDLAFVILHLFG